MWTRVLNGKIIVSQVVYIPIGWLRPHRHYSFRVLILKSGNENHPDSIPLAWLSLPVANLHSCLEDLEKVQFFGPVSGQMICCKVLNEGMIT